MKQLLVVLSALVLISCNKYDVAGTATGIKDGTKVFLVTSDSTGGPKPKDTVVVKEGKFEFEGKTEIPEIAFVSFDGIPNGSLPLILEKGSIKVDFDQKAPEKSKIGGTENNDLFQSYNNSNRNIQDRITKFLEPYKEVMQAVQMKKMNKQELTPEEQKTFDLIIAEGRKFQAETDKNSKAFLKKNPDKFVSVLLMENLFYSGKIKLEEAKTFYQNLSDELKNTISGKSIKKYIETLMVNQKAIEKKK